MRAGLPGEGLKLCKSEGVISSEGVKRAKSRAAQGLKSVRLRG